MCSTRWPRPSPIVRTITTTQPRESGGSALVGTTLVQGTLGDNNGEAPAAVELYDVVTGRMVQQLTDPGHPETSGYGWALALSDRTLAVAVERVPIAGAVHLFERRPGQWVRTRFSKELTHLQDGTSGFGFDPPLVFDAPDEAARTLTYCADFNNGVGDNGAPDLDGVTRSSRMPERTACTPTACASGKIGTPCDGVGDDAACDSSPGAGDGWCDACPITAGATTENEMFFLFPAYFRDE